MGIIFHPLGIKRPHPVELDNSEDDEGIMIPSANQKRLKVEEEVDDVISLETLRYVCRDWCSFMIDLESVT